MTSDHLTVTIRTRWFWHPARLLLLGVLRVLRPFLSPERFDALTDWMADHLVRIGVKVE